MLTPGTILQGRYRVERQLARGGMGTVYEATDERLDAVVALKETSFSEEDLRKAFEREARLLARLEHPALPRVSDHFTEGTGQFLVMQFVAGPDIEEMRRRREGGSFPSAQVLGWADQLLDALEYLHTQQPPVIHRDIKPQNLKLGARGQIILLDFGLAKGYATQTSPLAASVVGYTPAYAPLEQIQGAGTDERSDLYSLAATLYHLLTGTAPPNALARADAVLNGQPDPLRPADELSADVSSEVAAVLRQSMALRRDQRLSSAAAMRRALREADKSPRPQASRQGAATFVMPTPQTEPQQRAEHTQGRTQEPTARPATQNVAPPRQSVAPQSSAPSAAGASSAATLMQGRGPQQTLPHTPPGAAAPPRKSARPLLLGGLAALLLVGIVGAVLFFTVFRKSDSDGRETSSTAATGRSSSVASSSEKNSGEKNSGAGGVGAATEAGGVLTLEGHTGAVQSVAFSPDGKLIASGGEDQTVRLWDAQTGQLRQTSPVLGSDARPVAFSPDGKTLAVTLSFLTASNNCAVALFDTQGGRLGAEKLRIQVPVCPLSAVALSADGRTLAAGSSEIQIWDAQTGELKHKLEGNRTTLESLAFSPDGSLLAGTGHVDGGVWLWDARSGNLKQEIKAQDAPTVVAFSPDSKTLATGGYDGTLKLWDTSTGGAPRRSLDYASSSVVVSIAFSPDGSLVACGGAGPNGEVKVWDAMTGELKFDLHADGVANSLAFSPDGKQLTCASGKVVKIWNVSRSEK